MKITNKYAALIVFAIAAFMPFFSSAQQTEAVIDKIEFQELGDDISARKNLVLDNSGEACALIKVYAPLGDNLKIEGSSVFKVEEKENNQFLVWMIDGASKIKVSASDMKPTEIIFKNYGYPKLHQKTTYELRLTIGHESEDLRYRRKTKYVDTYDFDETRWYTFISYQFSYGYPFGLNVGFCKSFGFCAYLNYVDSSIQFGKGSDEVDDGTSDYRKWLTFGVGPMFRLSPHFYWQVGVGLSTDCEDSAWGINCGTTFIYRIKHFNIGLGYYYYGSSAQDERSVLIDGLTVQVGLNF